MDWDGIYTRRLSARCRQAATELRLDVQAPYEISVGDKVITFVAYFPWFGSKKGMLVALSSQWDAVHDIAAAAGYACVGLNPDHFSIYNRDQWLRVVNEWEWHGPEESNPLLSNS